MSATPLQHAILAHLEAHTRASIYTMADALGKKPKALQRSLGKLKKQGRVAHVGFEQSDPSKPGPVRVLWGLTGTPAFSDLGPSISKTQSKGVKKRPTYAGSGVVAGRIVIRGYANYPGKGSWGRYSG